MSEAEGRRGLDAFGERIRGAVASGISALVAMQRPGGKFVYRSGSGIPANDRKYNIVRHAGTIYALLDCRSYATVDIAGPVVAALRWVEEDHLRPATIAGRTFIAVTSDDDGRNDHEEAKLGGTALYLLAALCAGEAAIYRYPLDFLRHLAGFLASMQRPDGGFHSKFNRKIGQPDPRFESLYYPGEAALALVHMHRLDPQGPWLHCAEAALLFLEEKRRGQKTVEADHWALIATAEYFKLRPYGDTDAARRISAHALQVVHSMVLELRAGGEREERGCFTHDGRTCPTSTRLEGLVAIAPHLDQLGRASGADGVDLPLKKGATFLLDSQIGQGERAGAIPRASVAWLAQNHVNDARRVDEVRIDYIQHAICGLKGVRERFAEKPAKAAAKMV